MKKNSKANTAAGLFGIIVAVLVYVFYPNMWVTLAAFIFSLFFAVALRPFYQHLFEKRTKALPTTISVLRERGFENGAPEARVFYALLITQDIMLDVNDPAQKAILDDIYDKSVEAFTEKYEFFRNRYATVQEREMPMKICCGTCDAKMNSMSKTYRDWLQHVDVDNRSFPPKDNIDVFFHDQQFTDLSGVTHNAVTAVQFYRW